MEVVWTSEAKRTFILISDYIEQKWSNKEVREFVEKTEFTLSLIQKTPKMFKKSKVKNIFVGYITSQTSIFYKVKRSRIEILVFWDNRQNPSKLKSSLK